MGTKVKYMGVADEQILLAGDDFGGRLGDGIPNEVRFNRKNNWIVDAQEAGLSDDAVAVLVSVPDFKDVTGMERIPLNRHQTVFMGLRDGDRVSAPVDPAEDEGELQYAAPENDPDEEAKRQAVEIERQQLEAEEARRAAKAAAEAGKKK